MEFMLMPLKRFADFEGRSRRKEYWMFVLGCFCVSMGIGILGFILGQISPTLVLVTTALQSLFALATIVPHVACAIRRLHDQDKPGWILLLVLTVIGGLIVLFFMTQEGTRGSNKYGPDPKPGE